MSSLRESTWALKLKVESRVSPRYLTSSDGAITIEPQTMLRLGGGCGRLPWISSTCTWSAGVQEQAAICDVLLHHALKHFFQIRHDTSWTLSRGIQGGVACIKKAFGAQWQSVDKSSVDAEEGRALDGTLGNAPSAGSTVTCGSVHFYVLLSVRQIQLEPLKSISTDLQTVKAIY